VRAIPGTERPVILDHASQAARAQVRAEARANRG
jgi:hypothetical protein